MTIPTDGTREQGALTSDDAGTTPGRRREDAGTTPGRRRDDAGTTPGRRREDAGTTPGRHCPSPRRTRT
ncbi:MAG: hypothetical protein M0035_11600 [Actinomycetota bacterium]|nr:hypothetical protein [Actinomycetota bacterium]